MIIWEFDPELMQLRQSKVLEEHSYGVVYMAFGSEREDKGATNHDVDGEIKDRAPKFAVAAFTGSTGAKIFYHHLGRYFGEAFAVTYADFGSTGSNLYVGGSVDTCYW